MAPQQIATSQQTAITQPVGVVRSQRTISMEPVPLLPFSLEPVALLLVLGLFAWILIRILQRRRQRAAWPVPSLLGLEAAQPEPLRLPEPAPALPEGEPPSVEAEAEADEEAREEELELVV